MDLLPSALGNSLGHSFLQNQRARVGWGYWRTQGCCGRNSKTSHSPLSPATMAKCGPCNPGFLSSSQVALRVRPISVAELEEGATLIAHKVDEQVLGATVRCCRVEACSA